MLNGFNIMVSLNPKKVVKGSESQMFASAEIFSLLIVSSLAFASLPFPSLCIFSFESSLRP